MQDFHEIKCTGMWGINNGGGKTLQKNLRSGGARGVPFNLGFKIIPGGSIARFNRNLSLHPAA